MVVNLSLQPGTVKKLFVSKLQGPMSCQANHIMCRGGGPAEQHDDRVVTAVCRPCQFLVQANKEDGCCWCTAVVQVDFEWFGVKLLHNTHVYVAFIIILVRAEGIRKDIRLSRSWVLRPNILISNRIRNAVKLLHHRTVAAGCQRTRKEVSSTLVYRASNA